MTNAALNEIALHVADSALEFARGTGGVQRARAVRDNAPQFDTRIWAQIAELGWLGVGVDEHHGGLGMDTGAACALLESVGRVLLPEPLVPAIAAARLLSECNTDVAAGLLEPLVAGTRLCIPVRADNAETSAPLCLTHVPDAYPGAVLLVGAGAGDSFVIRAVDSTVAGVAASTDACVDGSILSTFHIQPAAWQASPMVAQGAAVQEAFARAHDTMLFGYAAYLVGLMHEALQLAIEYMKIRTQFGTPIGSFQALQHRAASCHVDIVASRALLYEASRCFDTPARARAASAAKARASAAALRVTKECVQFHGAIGFADEHDIGLYLRKAMTLAARYGGEMRQKLRFADLTAACPEGGN
ncbi:MAG TPA: acyl-CoA dehydrogenase family protein [Noviherbaspirillum sp.]|nr:acyl-CoA dehydrogenase family protein [Noviherbaspirillum sp.]